MPRFELSRSFVAGASLAALGGCLTLLELWRRRKQEFENEWSLDRKHTKARARLSLTPDHTEMLDLKGRATLLALQANMDAPAVCPSCGSEFLLDSHFCRKCGTKRPSGDQVTPATIQAAAKLGLTYIGEQEAKRIWNRLCLPGETPPNALTVDEFCSLLTKFHELQGFVEAVTSYQQSKSFEVPSDYDYSKPTSANYASESTEFHGPYWKARQGGTPPAARDYSYHNNYTRQRQDWQDAIVRSTITRHNPQSRPWIVFTCGAMGCGKGFTFKKLSERGYFPIENIVRIDPDFFKECMPEWRGYLEHGQDAGSMTHMESTYIQELCQEAALENSQNIWVDGSLHDRKWFALVFADIRKRYSHYRIGIFHVYADEEIVRQRVKSREEATGRGIPEAKLMKSLEAPAHTLFHLAPMCDWVVRIENNVEPVLKSFNHVDSTGNWGLMSERCASSQAAPHEFPCALAPIAVRSRKSIQLLGTIPKGGGQAKLMFESTTCKASLTPPFWKIEKHNRIMGLRGESMIPADACFSCYCRPLEPSSGLFPSGGFLYFNKQNEVCAALEIMGQKGLTDFSGVMEFSSPVDVKKRSLPYVLRNDDRWFETTLPDLIKGGAQRYTWLGAGEVRRQISWSRKSGLLYDLGDRYVFFAVRAPAK